MAEKQEQNNKIPHEKTALDFDRDKNLIYRPQDEGYDEEYRAEAEGPSQVPDKDPYKNPLANESKEEAWMQTNEAGVSGQFDEQDTDDRDEDTRPRSTVNTVKH